MNEGEEHLTVAPLAPEDSVHTSIDSIEGLSTSHEMGNTQRSSRSLSMQNEDSLAGDSVRLDALVELLATDGPSSRDQYQEESTAEAIHASSPSNLPGRPLLPGCSDPFQTPERRPHVRD